MNGLDDRLTSAFDGVRAWTPDTAGRFPAVAERARRRQATQRLVAAAALVLAALGVAGAVAVSADQDSASTVSVIDGGPDGVSEPAPEPESESDDAPEPEPAPTPPTSVGVVKDPGSSPLREARSDGTTTTTAPPPPAPQGPPDAYVSVKATEVKAAQGSYCWSRSRDEASMCADTHGDYAKDAPVLRVHEGDVVSVRWPTRDTPVEVQGYLVAEGESWTAREPKFVCEGGNPCRMSLRAKPGEYVLHISTRWRQGSALYGVKVVVEAAS